MKLLVYQGRHACIQKGTEIFLARIQIGKIYQAAASKIIIRDPFPFPFSRVRDVILLSSLEIG